MCVEEIDEKNGPVPVRRGLLIAFEGIDGTGKTTQLRLVAEALQDEGFEVVTTREPTNGPHGRKIRALFTNRQSVSPEEELALFIKDRRQHVSEVINPSLAAGKIVLTDRYYFSTAAYQGAAGQDPAEILARNEQFAPVPDLVLLLTASPSLGVHRVRQLRREALNDFEGEEELKKVAEVFAGLTRACIRRVDSGRGISEVHDEIMRHVRELLLSKGYQGK